MILDILHRTSFPSDNVVGSKPCVQTLKHVPIDARVGDIGKVAVMLFDWLEIYHPDVSFGDGPV